MDFQPEPRSPEARREFVREALAGAMRAAPTAAVAVRLVYAAAASSDFGRVSMGWNWWDAPEGDRGHFLLCRLRLDDTMPQGVRLHCGQHGRFSGPVASMQWALAHPIEPPELPETDRAWLGAELAALLSAPP